MEKEEEKILPLQEKGEKVEEEEESHPEALHPRNYHQNNVQ